MDKQRFFRLHILISLGLITLAILLHFSLNSLLTPLPSGYANETHYAADTSFRESPTAG